MMPQPTGRLVRKDDGVYLVLDRMFKAPIEEVWTFFSRSPRLAEWLGEYKGTGSTGAVKFRLTADGDDAEWQDVSVMECSAPHRLHADVGGAGASHRMFVHLREASGHTTVTLGRRLRSLVEEADSGPRWDYYLDRLVAAHDHKPLPEWSSYSPAMTDHYRTLCRELDRDLRSEHTAARAGTTG
ncbi:MULTISPECIES: SRPBCC domain-containing protein [Microbacteriaceae]|uniref:SRPBCC domain-containing protein n=1 Tax=Microbacteriaceae TaxID=85023 RepID=UPI00036FA111|nr:MULTISPECIES: SRPBCC domain-containing protein [Microbacteriaceae]TDQ02033.1 activator of Hsp90 ATPase-like protein [Leifsonia sp. 115AMFTsu3.1]